MVIPQKHKSLHVDCLAPRIWNLSHMQTQAIVQTLSLNCDRIMNFKNFAWEPGCLPNIRLENLLWIKLYNELKSIRCQLLVEGFI